ncbi:hypothetical protein DMB66_03295 [Actinoplanes sp. ATCC 53533]|uniref:hypothetical protein n=1 Tax=Actinoplanes sp. ATCC 53533 TaxID=1288362 RepID=UPI000F785446|nr:hypothetical protein [Actinoplanes sp. ATCC 53533]RSM73086.1 hypothetical protein DMB66_03295 [Actinoplanes sp. ATCC 53533]
MAVDDFLPSRHGFAFTNAWPDQPAVTLPTPFGDIGIGNAGGGLCGGMAFAALDYWLAGRAPGLDRPAAGDPLYRYIVDRLIDSWHAPAGVAQFYQWMSLPDGDNVIKLFGRRVVTERGLGWRTVRVQWPQIKKDLDRGLPVPIGVVTTASRNPKDLGLNHQVLAYGSGADGSRVTLRVYDPNRGRRDDITIRMDTSAPARPVTFDHNLGLGQRPIRGFFRVAYTPRQPA